jgi:polyisoprenoid-binding protein YceI
MNRIFQNAVCIFILFLTPSLWSAPCLEKLSKSSTCYEIDPVHSSIEFKINHFFTPVVGRFGTFQGSIVYDPEDLENCKVDSQIEIKSIATNNTKRDDHLLTDDFFKAAVFPQASFQSEKWEKAAGNNQFYNVRGQLTLLGKTLPVDLKVELLGAGPGMGDAYISGWKAKTTINRDAWGMNSWKPMIGSEVEIEINIEATRTNNSST